MLVVSRKKGESVTIGNDITVSIVEIVGDKVRLGIKVPVGKPVRRREIVTADPSKPRPGEDRLPGIHDIEILIREKVTQEGGDVTDIQHRGGSFFVRSLLPEKADIDRGDMIQPGLAVRVEPRSIYVAHYIVRRVCTNGTISHTFGPSRGIMRADPSASVEVVQHVVAEICKAFKMYCSPEYLAVTAERMKAAKVKEVTLRQLAAVKTFIDRTDSENVYAEIHPPLQ